MAKLPPHLQKVALFLERLPGIGEKTANRLAFYFLRIPEADLKEFADNIANLKSKTKLCNECLNLTEDELSSICQDPQRDKSKVTVVEQVLDLLSFEIGNIYNGVYHVLHGRIDPLNNVRPEDIYIEKLISKLKTPACSPRVEAGRQARQNAKLIKEIILATNPDMEGEATAMFIRNRLNEIKQEKKLDFKITRLAYGLPIGANLEYADYMTLRKAIEGRNDY